MPTFERAPYPPYGAVSERMVGPTGRVDKRSASTIPVGRERRRLDRSGAWWMRRGRGRRSNADLGARALSTLRTGLLNKARAANQIQDLEA